MNIQALKYAAYVLKPGALEYKREDIKRIMTNGDLASMQRGKEIDARLCTFMWPRFAVYTAVALAAISIVAVAFLNPTAILTATVAALDIAMIGAATLYLYDYCADDIRIYGGQKTLDMW